jgi:hypothetical protein
MEDKIRTFPIPSRPAPSGGEDPTKAYNKGGHVPPFKGEGAKMAHYAEGGAVLGRTREFMKEPSPFRSSMDGLPPKNQILGEGGEPTNVYGKGGQGQAKGSEKNPPGKDKSLKTVKPRT